MNQRSVFLSGVLGFTAATGGCSVLIDADTKQCEVTSDCTARGAAFEGAVCEKNLCVIKGVDPVGGAGAGGGGADNPLECEAPEPNDQTTVKFSFAPTFAVPPDEPQPFVVKACRSLDPDCEAPVYGPVEVEALEVHDFEVPKNFDGFFEIENPDTRTALYYMGRALVEDTTGWNVTVPSEQTILALGAAAKRDVDLELGVLIAMARDCQLQPLAGVELQSSVDALRFYFYQTIPYTDETVTGPQGVVGFANAPIGAVKLSATAANGTELTPVLVRLKSGYVTFTEVFP